MSNDLKINYLELPASDFKPLRFFYSQLFQWQFTAYGEDYLAFTDGVMQGGFYRSDKRANSREAGGVLIVLYCKDLEHIKNRVVQAGGEIVLDTFAFPGGRRFHFTDPQGNELAIWTDQKS